MQVHSTIVVALQKPLAACVNGWRHLNARRLSVYRPEKHYMRGPGPKCREKLARTEHVSGPAADVVMSLGLSLELGQAR